MFSRKATLYDNGKTYSGEILFIAHDAEGKLFKFRTDDGEYMWVRGVVALDDTETRMGGSRNE